MTSGIHYLTCGEAGAGKGIHNSRDFPRETNWRRGVYTYARAGPPTVHYTRRIVIIIVYMYIIYVHAIIILSAMPFCFNSKVSSRIHQPPPGSR